MIATKRLLEWLRLEPVSVRSEAFFTPLLAAAVDADTETLITTEHVGGDLLFLWGPGAPNRWPAMEAQRAAGKHVVCADLAYWNRDKKVRLSIDAPHPQAWVMRQDWPSSRFTADPVKLEDRWNPDGPIVIAGIGAKASVQYGEQVERWEAAQVARCQTLWPQRLILYRRKRGQGHAARGTTLSLEGPIDRVIAGASLVLTWHSNVAVDAIRLGIPVVCRDGAAAAVCPSEIHPDRRPLDPELRRRFLHNLAWFQWRADEPVACWSWLQELLR